MKGDQIKGLRFAFKGTPSGDVKWIAGLILKIGNRWAVYKYKCRNGQWQPSLAACVRYLANEALSELELSRRPNCLLELDTYIRGRAQAALAQGGRIRIPKKSWQVIS